MTKERISSRIEKGSFNCLKTYAGFLDKPMQEIIELGIERVILTDPAYISILLHLKENNEDSFVRIGGKYLEEKGYDLKKIQKKLEKNELLQMFETD